MAGEGFVAHMIATLKTIKEIVFLLLIKSKILKRLKNLNFILKIRQALQS